MNIFQKLLYRLNPSLYQSMNHDGSFVGEGENDIFINVADRIEFDAKAQITGNDGYWLTYVETTNCDFDGLMEVSTRFYVTVDGVRFYLEAEFDCSVADETRALVDVLGCTLFEISRATLANGTPTVLSLSAEAETAILTAISTRLKNEPYVLGMPDYDNL